MAGYWPSSFFACLWTETELRSTTSQKRTRPLSSHLDLTNLVNKGFIIWLSGKVFLRDTAGSLEWARELLTYRGSRNTCVSRQTQDVRKRLHAVHEPLLISQRKETKIQVLVNFDSIKVSLFLHN